MRAVRRLVCAATIAVGVFAGVAGASGQARASASIAAPSARDRATCRAFKAYERKGTAARFRVMVRDSGSALWFLRVDVRGWQADRSHRAPSWVLGMDRGLVTQDCDDPAAEMDG